jgi:redox-regulated HSP33 family molecular chaperone
LINTHSQESNYFYSGEQIEKELNLYTRSGKPAVKAVGEIIKQLPITHIEQKMVWESTMNWTGTIRKYTKSVIDKIEQYYLFKLTGASSTILTMLTILLFLILSPFMVYSII